MLDIPIFVHRHPKPCEPQRFAAQKVHREREGQQESILRYLLQTVIIGFDGFGPHQKNPRLSAQCKLLLLPSPLLKCAAPKRAHISKAQRRAPREQDLDES